MSIDELTNELERRLSYDGDLNHITLIESSGVIGRVASIILGILSLMIIILVPIIITMEVMYICFPAIREKTNELITKLETKGADKRLLGIAFRDAKHAVEQVYCHGELNGTIGDMLWVYLKIKVKSIIFIFFLLSLVLQGGGYIIDLVWNLIGNFLEHLFY